MSKIEVRDSTQRDCRCCFGLHVCVHPSMTQALKCVVQLFPLCLVTLFGHLGCLIVHYLGERLSHFFYLCYSSGRRVMTLVVILWPLLFSSFYWTEKTIGVPLYPWIEHYLPGMHSIKESFMSFIFFAASLSVLDGLWTPFLAFCHSLGFLWRRRESLNLHSSLPCEWFCSFCIEWIRVLDFMTLSGEGLSF